MPIPPRVIQDHSHEQYEPIEPPHIESGEIFENDPVRDKKLPRRRLARERVMQMLYAHELSQRDIDGLFFEMIQNGIERVDQTAEDPALEFARELTLRLTSHREEIDALISEKLRHWDLRRIALIDRLLIQMGITELLYFPEIPPKATINELIEIAKDYSTDESGKFINGILHAVMTALKESGQLNKTGRGLLEKTMPPNSSTETPNTPTESIGDAISDIQDL